MEGVSTDFHAELLRPIHMGTVNGLRQRYGERHTVACATRFCCMDD